MTRRWKRLSHEIEVLGVRFRRNPYQVPFPDLSVESRAAPMSQTIAIPGAWTPARVQPQGAKQFPVGHSHKQDLQMLTPDAIKNEMPYMGGKKT